MSEKPPFFHTRYEKEPIALGSSNYSLSNMKIKAEHENIRQGWNDKQGEVENPWETEIRSRFTVCCIALLVNVLLCEVMFPFFSVFWKMLFIPHSWRQASKRIHYPNVSLPLKFSYLKKLINPWIPLWVKL